MSDLAMNQQSGGQLADASTMNAYRGLIARMPVTMRPSLNQQLNQWEMLFPFEQRRLAAFFRGIESFQPAALDALTAPLRTLETKMGVARWNFTETSETMENASLLARSEFYAEWRRDVQQIFSAVEAASGSAHQAQSNPAKPSQARLVVLILPASLPIDTPAAWAQWDRRGQEIRIDGDARRLSELLLQSQLGLEMQADKDRSDLWLIDAGSDLKHNLPSSAPAYSLSYASMKDFRDKFLAAVNTVPKNIQATDQVLTAVRHHDWSQDWPAELSDQPRLRNFVIDLFLSGNGALIFSNAFVEWAASEALRRARPRVLIARFGMRSKPKPFTSIAIFENQQRISALPDVDDPEGSAIDALILARYVWSAAIRYPEGAQTCGLCIAESSNSVWLILPPDRPSPWKTGQAVKPEELGVWIESTL
jgi:hypothetical protein